ncbi:HAD family hydrolase [Saccharothrix sp. NRRL B-16314]|uniref:HAD family hydrolase n=1 Tax=Saccharothrix sp. NRRL B-16314 TaxID=1463825 RepID=UPI0005251CA1|nr:HAD family hydrolase [Saccharothrix sp. NRRL B-16314]
MVTVVLDIDGTLLHSVRQHQAALVRAYAHFPVPTVTGGWDRFRHHTDSGILDELFEAGVGRGVSPEELARLDSLLTEYFVEELAREPLEEVPGAARLIAELAESDSCTAVVATGGMAGVTALKLAHFGTAAERFPVVTASDHLSRVEIVAAAVERAGHEPAGNERAGHLRAAGHERAGHERAGHERAGHERAGHERAGHERAGHEPAGHLRAVSVGDGVWDAEAAAALGLPFVGIGPDPGRFQGTAARVDPDLAVLGCADLVALAGGAS